MNIIGQPRRVPVPGPPGEGELGDDQRQAQARVPRGEGERGAHGELPQRCQPGHQRQPQVEEEAAGGVLGSVGGDLVAAAPGEAAVPPGAGLHRVEQEAARPPPVGENGLAPPHLVSKATFQLLLFTIN